MKHLLELIWELRDALERGDEDGITDAWNDLNELADRQWPFRRWLWGIR